MDDLISRQDTIDAINKQADEQLEWTLIGSQYTRSATSVVMAMPPANVGDTISRQEAIDVLKRNYPSSCFEDLCKAVDIAIKALSEQPEIIRCKVCKHRNTDECPMYYEEWIEYDEGDGFIERDFISHDRTVGDGFCDKGERREDRTDE